MADVVGRDEERSAIGRYFERPWPAALLIDGEAGIGKTTVWREAVREAETRGCRLLSANPGESEEQLPYAALGDLLASTVDDAIGELPSPQRRALTVALLLEDPGEAPAPDQRAIALALLGLLRMLVEDAAVVLAIDDVQWLDADSEATLEFVCRRLGGLRVGLVLA